MILKIILDVTAKFDGSLHKVDSDYNGIVCVVTFGLETLYI